VLGPRKLPEVARQVGKLYGEVRRATWELRSTLDAEIHAEEREKRRLDAEDRRNKFRAEREAAKAAGEWPPGGAAPADAPGPTVVPEEAPAPEADLAATDPGLPAVTEPKASDA